MDDFNEGVTLTTLSTDRNCNHEYMINILSEKITHLEEKHKYLLEALTSTVQFETAVKQKLDENDGASICFQKRILSRLQNIEKKVTNIERTIIDTHNVDKNTYENSIGSYINAMIDGGIEKDNSSKIEDRTNQLPLISINNPSREEPTSSHLHVSNEMIRTDQVMHLETNEETRYSLGSNIMIDHTPSEIESVNPPDTKSPNTLENKRLSYIDTFTMHGVGRMFSGHLLERLFWFCVVTVTISITLLIAHQHIEDYYSREVRTEVRVKSETSLPLPSITICSKIESQRRLSCYLNNSVSIENTTCSSTLENPFNITFRYYNKETFVRELKDNCVSYNPNGDLKQYGTGIPLYIYITSWHPDEQFRLFFTDKLGNHSGLSVPEISSGQNIYPGIYTTLLERTLTYRKPFPYPSNCSDGENIEHYFSDEYTERSCLETCLMKKMYSECGAVLDWWRDYIKPEHDRKVSKSYSELQMCLLRQSMSAAGGNFTGCRCPMPCKSTEFKPLFLRSSHVNYWGISLQYRSMETTHIWEKELYPLKNVFSNVGGTLGLYTGMSVISMLEIIIFVCLSLAALSRKRKK